MAVTTDIARTWRAPGAVVADHLAQGRREDRALLFLMLACLILFLARWPALSRQVALTGGDLTQLVTYALFGTVILLPLILYGLAALLFLAGRAMMPGLTPFGARLSLFWALLAASPAALLWGLSAGFIGPGLQTTLTGAIWVAAVLWFALTGLRTAGRGQPA
jgi:hypothetical protein